MCTDTQRYTNKRARTGRRQDQVPFGQMKHAFHKNCVTKNLIIFLILLLVIFLLLLPQQQIAAMLLRIPVAHRSHPNPSYSPNLPAQLSNSYAHILQHVCTKCMLPKISKIYTETKSLSAYLCFFLLPLSSVIFRQDDKKYTNDQNLNCALVFILSWHSFFNMFWIQLFSA